MNIISTLGQNHIDFVRVNNVPVIRMGCPLCGKGEDDITLWFNYIKRKGGCFRCELFYKTEQEFLKLFSIRTVNDEISFEEPQKKKKPLMSNLPEEAIAAHTDRKARWYLQSRGLSISDMKRFAMLYCPTGFYEKRVIIPIFNRGGGYRTFIARSIDPNVEKKYLFPKGGAVSSLLYNLHFIKNTNKVYIHEGPFDCIHNFPYSVGTFGKHISYRQIQLLRLHGINTVYLGFDWDSWAVTPSLLERTTQQLKKYFYTYVIKLPREKTDPTDYSLAELHSMAEEVRLRL